MNDKGTLGEKDGTPSAPERSRTYNLAIITSGRITRSIVTNLRHTARIRFSNVVLLCSDDENDKC